MTQPLISQEQLQQRLLEEDNIVIADAVSISNPQVSQERSKDKMIPSAIRFDYDKDFATDAPCFLTCFLRKTL